MIKFPTSGQYRVKIQMLKDCFPRQHADLSDGSQKVASLADLQAYISHPLSYCLYRVAMRQPLRVCCFEVPGTHLEPPPPTRTGLFYVFLGFLSGVADVIGEPLYSLLRPIFYLLSPAKRSSLLLSFCSVYGRQGEQGSCCSALPPTN